MNTVKEGGGGRHMELEKNINGLRTHSKLCYKDFFV